jgi:hypothetical protein
MKGGVRMTIHYPTDYRLGKVLVSVDNRTATKVSVWVDSEDKPRQKFSGDTAYQDAMNLALNLSDDDDFNSLGGFEFATGTGIYSGSFGDDNY